MPRKTLEIWVAVDEDGDYETGHPEAEAIERYRDNYSDTAAIRLIRIVIDVPLPTPLKVTGRVEDGATATLVQAEVK